MPLPSLANAFQPQNPDIEKTALYPRQVKSEAEVQDGSKKKRNGASLGFLDLLKGNGENGKQGSPIFTTALSQLERPAGNINDILAYWQSVTQASKDEKERLTVRLQSALKQVRLEGFKQASKAKTWPARIFWLIMILFIITALIYECVKCYNDYVNSPVTTKFTIATPPKMDFPNVYICYASAINRTYGHEHKDVMAAAIAYRSRDVVTKKVKPRGKREAVQLDDEEIIEMLMERSRRKRNANWEGGNEESDGFGEMERGRFRRDTRGGNTTNATDANVTSLVEKSAEAAAAEARLEAMLNMANISEVIYKYYREAGFSMEETFLECGFEGYETEKLNCRDIIRPVVDANYFLCYLIDLPDRLKQTTAGKGLNLILNSHVNLYPMEKNEKPPEYSGIVVSVDKHYNPFNWEKTCLTGGKITKIDLSMTHVHLKDINTGQFVQHCLTDERAKDIFQIFKSNYSRTTCQMDCLFQSHRNNCDCLMLVDRTLLKDNVVSTTGFCSPEQYTYCVAALPANDTVQKAVNACTAQCYAPCESYRYGMRASHAKLHVPSYERFNFPANITSKQLVDLRVAFSRLEYADLIQQPSASLADLIANLGGQINLWLGASLISLLQMGFMFVGLVVWSFFTKVLKRRCSRKKVDGEERQPKKV